MNCVNIRVTGDDSSKSGVLTTAKDTGDACERRIRRRTSKAPPPTSVERLSAADEI